MLRLRPVSAWLPAALTCLAISVGCPQSARAAEAGRRASPLHSIRAAAKKDRSSSPALPQSPKPGLAVADQKISFGLAFGDASPLSKQFPSLYELPYPQSLAVTRDALTRIVRVALLETRSQPRQLIFGPGGWKEFPVQPSAQLDVRARKAETIRLMCILGYLAQQTSVIASRVMPEGPTRAIQIVQTRGTDLASPVGATRFWRRLAQLAPKLEQGFLPVQVAGNPGIRIIDTDGSWTDSEAAGFGPIVDTVASEQGLSLTSTPLRVELLEVRNDWSATPTGQRYLDQITGPNAPRLRRRLRSRYRQAAFGWIRSAFRTYLRPLPRGARRPLIESPTQAALPMVRAGSNGQPSAGR